MGRVPPGCFPAAGRASRQVGRVPRETRCIGPHPGGGKGAGYRPPALGDPEPWGRHLPRAGPDPLHWPRGAHQHQEERDGVEAKGDMPGHGPAQPQRWSVSRETAPTAQSPTAHHEEASPDAEGQVPSLTRSSRPSGGGPTSDREAPRASQQGPRRRSSDHVWPSAPPDRHRRHVAVTTGALDAPVGRSSPAATDVPGISAAPPRPG